MTFVVDASVALAWFLPGEATKPTDDVLRRLASEPAVAPALWQLEIANVLVQKRRNGSLSDAAVARIVSLIVTLPIRIVSTSSPTISELVATASRHSLASYDSEYLLLAQREGVGLATLDRDLAKAARKSGVKLIVGS